MSIAEAAVYLKFHEPDLGIENPYELNEEQFDAAIDLLKEQQPNVGEYWAKRPSRSPAFANGDITVGHHLAVPVLRAARRRRAGRGQPGQPGLPAEGGCDRMVGHLDDQLQDAKHPNCMYEWMNWIIEPKVNAEVAEFFGEAPAQELACKETENKNFCAEYHAEEPGSSGSGSTTGKPRSPTAATARKIARTTTTGSKPGPRSKADPVAESMAI